MWSLSKALQIPVDSTIKQLFELPFTISFCIRKRLQIDGLSELSRDKRPPDKIIWDGTGEEIDAWLDKVLYNKKPTESILEIDAREIEN